MSFSPPRGPGLAFGVGALIVLTAAVGFSIARLGESLISPLVLLWIVIPLAALALGLMIAYRLYGLITASYRLDRDGFYLRWGLAREQIPLHAIKSLESAAEAGYPPPGLWWPGCYVGNRQGSHGAVTEFFSSRRGEAALVLVLSAGRRLVISPADLQAFQGAFVDATRMGSLEPIPERSERPDFFFSELWSDGLARGLILVGLMIPLLTLGYLGLRAPELPALVPFGFDPSGIPDPLAPPGRLLLLPLIAAAAWLIDLGLGMWFYRQEADRRLAYLLWGIAILSGGLFFGAAVTLLS